MALTPILTTFNSVNGATRAHEDDSRKRTDAELAAGVMPVNYAYNPDFLDLRRFGASLTASTDVNWGALQAALSVIYQAGGGAIYCHDLYDIGDNIITLVDQGNLNTDSSIYFIGARRPHQNRPDSPNNCGFTGTHASGILKLGNGTAKCSASLRFENFAFIYGASNQTVLVNFLNDSDPIDPQVNVDLDYVTVIGSGAGTTCVQAGKSPDGHWNNVCVSGHGGEQPSRGIQIRSECSRMVNCAIRFCDTGLYVPDGQTWAGVMDSCWILQCNTYLIYFEAPAGSRSTRPTFINCFIGECQGSAEQCIAVYSQAGSFENYATFVGCTFDRNNDSDNPVIQWLSPGCVTLIGCCNVNGDNNVGAAADIQLGTLSSNLVMIGCNRFIDIDTSVRTEGTTKGLHLMGNDDLQNQQNNEYRQGVWTPGITFGGSATGVTASTAAGSYTKHGSLVTCYGRLTLTNNGSGTGVAVITGLPFTVLDTLTGSNDGGGYFSIALNYGVAGSAFSLAPIDATTTAQIWVSTPAITAHVQALETDITNTFDGRFVITYRTAS